jgi:hypothetical protein
VEQTETELPSSLEKLLSLDGDAERELLDQILTSGWEQGCLLDLGDGAQPPALSPTAIRLLLGRLDGREARYPSKGLTDPFEAEPLAQGDPGEREEGYLVVSQRCDLIKGIAAEPLVTVGYAFCCNRASLVSAARAGTSATHLHLCDVGDNNAWLLDLRSLGYVPKTWLSERTPIHLIEPGLARRRFARDLGARSSRAPLPTGLVDHVQNPLRDWLYKSAKRRELCEPFSEFLLVEGTDGWGLLAILGEGQDADAAAEQFDELFKQIDARLGDFQFDQDASDVIRLDQLSAADYLTAHRLDLNRVSYGSKASAEQAPPL